MKLPARPLLACLLAGTVLALLLVVRTPRSLPQSVSDRWLHPLDPLSAAEMEQAARLLRAEPHLPAEALYAALVLREPPKEEGLAYRPGQPYRREAFAILYDRKGNQTYEAVVDLAAGRVASVRAVPGVQPRILGEEFDVVQNFVRADRQVQAALRRRGLDPEHVYVELWATSARPGPHQHAGGRLGRALFYDRREGSNAYLHPIAGLMAMLDLNSREVVDLVDNETLPVPDNHDNFLDPHQLGRPPLVAPRAPAEPPPGATFTVRGHEVRWGNWSFRFTNHPREALVLHQVTYHDHGQARPVLYRASLAELVVPYGDPDPAWNWRAPFDEGEYGLGLATMPLARGQQVPMDALLLDSLFANEHGSPEVSPATVAVYERDGGVLWQHTDVGPTRLALRRARELVITCEIVAGNYDYGLSWIFGQDGQLRAEVELGGIPLARAARTTTCQRCAGTDMSGPAEDGHGTVTAAHIVAANHQHWFCFRLDPDVDGPANTVSELSVHPAADAEGAAFVVDERVLATEQEAGRDLDLASQRRWKVYNPERRTALGHHPGYVLEPGENTVPHQLADSAVRRRAPFLDHHLWVTRYRPDELYPAGGYPASSTGGDGLAKFVRDNEKLEGQDVVLWYTCGVTHVPRPEDWPVMPSVRVGFRLVPHGFFTHNPALDVPDR